MPKLYRYICGNCGQDFQNAEAARKNLVVKKVEFRQYGFKGKLIRSRTLRWLCRSCMLADEQYNLPESNVSEGMLK